MGYEAQSFQKSQHSVRGKTICTFLTQDESSYVMKRGFTYCIQKSLWCLLEFCCASCSEIPENWYNSSLGRDSSVGITTRYSVRGSNSGRGEIFRTRPDRPWGAHPASYAMGTGYFLGVKRPGRGVNHRPPHLAPRLRNEQSYTSTPPVGLRGLF